MHTFEAKGALFNYNGDLSGDVIITVEQVTRPGLTLELAVPGDALRAFAAHIVRLERIRRLENASDDEVLS